MITTNDCEMITTNDCETTQAPPRLSKHMEINNAISSLDECAIYLRTLIARIHGEEMKGQESIAVDPIDSLADTLDYAPERIAIKREDILALIHQLDDTLW